MANKRSKSAAPKKAALTPEEFQKLSPEEQEAFIADALAAKAENADLKAAQGKAKGPKELPSFEVDDTDEDGNETGNVLKYKFVVPLFHIDKVEYTAHEAVNKAEVLAHLVSIGSGIIERIEEGGE